MPIVVKAQPNDNTDQVIRKFKKLVLQEQLLTKLKDKAHYKKPAIKKKEKLNELRRRRKRLSKKK